MYKRLLVWDIDGTLMISEGIGRKSMGAAFEEVFGIKGALEGVVMTGRLDPVILAEVFAKFGIPEAKMESFLPCYYRRLEANAKGVVNSMVPPGVKEILEATSSDGETLNILGTGNTETGARIKLSMHDLNKYFPLGGFPENKFEERWQVIAKGIKQAEAFGKTSFFKDSIYVIGDTPLDIECGKLAGARTVGVATGWHSVAELQQCSPDHLYKDFSNYRDFLEMLYVK